MALSPGWVRHLPRRAHASVPRATWITLALLLVTRGASAEPLTGRGADVIHLRARSVEAGALPRAAAEVVELGLSGAGGCRRSRVAAAKGGAALRLYLDAARAGQAHRFSQKRPQGGSSIEQGLVPGGGSGARGKVPAGMAPDLADDVWNAIEFMSDPLPQPAVFSGAFSGRLDVVSSRKDFNISVMLFERTLAGVYVPLSSYLGRASALSDPSRPQPLTPGVRQLLAFRGGRPLSHRVERGSRLVLVLGIIKDSGPPKDGPGQPNGGRTTEAPLTIHWFDDSYIELQISGGTEDGPGWKRPAPDGRTLPLPRSPARSAETKIAEA